MQRTDRFLFGAGAVVIAVYFFRLTRPSLHVFFTPDDLMNLYRSWIFPTGLLVKANFLFFLTSPFLRPMGSVWYRVIFHFAGFNPFWFHAVNLAILMLNVFLTYAVVRRLTGSREVAAVAALLGAYNRGLGCLYFDTGYVYDVLCYLFYFAAFLFYVRVRQQKRLLNGWETAGCCALYICALNAKEMAVTLPAFLAIYEWLYHPPRSWRRSEWFAWAWREGRVALITGAMTLVFAVGRATGPETLLKDAPYRPSFTWTQFMETSRRFLGDIAGTHAWSVRTVLLLWVVLFAIAWISKSPSLKFAWLFVMLSPVPVAFILPRGAPQYYVPWFGWVLYSAVVLVRPLEYLTGKLWTGAWLARARGTALIAALVLILYPYCKRAGWWNVTSAWIEAPQNRETVAQLHRAAPRLRPRSRLLFWNDPISSDIENLIFMVQLSYHDPSLEVKRVKQMKQAPDEKEMAAYDYVFDYRDGQFIELRQP